MFGKLIKTKGYLLITLLCILSHNHAVSQLIGLQGFDVSSYPKISAKLMLFDTSTGLFLHSLENAELRVIENGINRTVTVTKLPNSKIVTPLSMLLAIDVNSTMNLPFGNEKRIQSAQRMALTTIRAIQFPESEIAVMAFSSNCSVLQDYTVFSEKAIPSVSGISIGNKTTFTNAFTQEYSGILGILKRSASNPKVLIITDSKEEFDTQAIIAELNAKSCEVFVLSIRENYSTSLEQIAIQTNGKYINNLQSEKELQSALFSILQQIHTNHSEFLVEWQSEIHCEKNESDVTIEYLPLNGKVETTYLHPFTYKSSVTVIPESMRFPVRGETIEYDTTITFTSSVPINITSVTVTNPSIVVSPTQTQFMAGETKTFRIQYTSLDTGYRFETIQFIGNDCTFELPISIGSRTTFSTAASPLKITKPNGGETLYFTTEATIEWEGTAPHDSVSIDYSPNNGVSWFPIVESAGGNSYLWNYVTGPTSNNCLMRVSKLLSDSTSQSHFIQKDTILHNRYWLNNSKNYLFAKGEYELLSYDVITRKFTSFLSSKEEKLVRPGIDTELKYVLTINDTTKELFLLDAKTGNVIRKRELWGMRFGFKQTWHPTKPIVVYTDRFEYIYDRLMIWNVETNEIDSIVFNTTNKLEGVFLSPDGNSIGAFFQNHLPNQSKIRTYNLTTKAKIVEIDFPGPYVETIRFSDDNTRIIATSNRRTYYFHYLAGSLQKYHELPADQNYHGILLSPNLKYVIAKTNRQAFHLYDLTAEKVLRTFPSPNSNEITQIHWSPDSKSLIIQRQDTTTQYVVIEKDVVVSDTTDATFSIKFIDFAIAHIDFGEVEVGTSKDSLLIGYFVNNTNVPFEVDSVRFFMGQTTAFSIVDNGVPFVIPPYSAHTTEFRFTPIMPGKQGCEMQFFKKDNNLPIGSCVISGIGVVNTNKQSIKAIDFGEVNVRTTKDSLQVPIFENNTLYTITIDSIVVRTLNGNDFTTSSITTNIQVPRFSSHSIDLHFTPSRGGVIQGTAEIYYNNPLSPFTVNLVGVGITTGEYVIEAGNVETTVGEIVDIPFTVRGRSKEGITTEKLISFDVDYRTSVALPMGIASLPFTNEISTVRMTNLPLKTGIIGEIKMRIGLGDQKVSIVGIHNLETNVPTDITSIDGSITLIDLCEEGGTRLLNPTGRTGVVALTVKDGRIELELDRAEAGSAQLSITNQIGQTVYSAEIPHSEVATSFASLSTNNFSSGVYYVTFSTATTSQTVPVMIVK